MFGVPFGASWIIWVLVFGPLGLVLMALKQGRFNPVSFLTQLGIPCAVVLGSGLTALFFAVHIIFGLLGAYIFTAAFSNTTVFPVLLFWWAYNFSLEGYWNHIVFASDQTGPPRRDDILAIFVLGIFKFLVYCAFSYIIGNVMPFVATWLVFPFIWNVLQLCFTILIIFRIVTGDRRHRS